MEHRTLSPDEILPPLVPIREDMDAEAFRELVSNIREHGLMQPLVVTPVDGKYRLIAGYRRWRACIEAGLTTIPVVERVASEQDEVELMLSENLHREDPNPLDEGRVYAILQEARGLTIAQIAGRINKSEGYVGTRLAIFHGPADLREALRAGSISLSVARELARCTHDGDRAFFLQHAVSGGATADTVRRWVSEAALRRLQVTERPVAPGAAVPLDAPPVMQATCEWGGHQVPMEQTLSFRVCGDHYGFLLALRDRVRADERAGADKGE